MEFMSYDNKKIWYTVWEAEAPRACIQVMTGLAEMADYYEEFAAVMNKAGYTVALHEFRGHGRSTDEYGEGNLFRNYARDGAQLCDMIRRTHPGLPVVLFGHSLGTTVSQIAIYEKMARWDGVMYTGPSHSTFHIGRRDELLDEVDQCISKYGRFRMKRAPSLSSRRTGRNGNGSHRCPTQVLLTVTAFSMISSFYRLIFP